MYILKPEMAQKLRQTTSEIFVNSPEFLHESQFIATVGDICTIKIIKEIRIPNLMIVDYKTKRKVNLSNRQKKFIDNIECNTIELTNEAGTISKELDDQIKKAISKNKRTKIIVNGEEDLATLPVIKHCQIGAKVIYGMPDRGMVVVDVNQQAKKRANDFLNRMLVK